MASSMSLFVEPHGLRHETEHGLKLKFYATIKDIEARVNQGRTERIALDSFIVSPHDARLKWGDGWQTLDDYGKCHVLIIKDEPDGVWLGCSECCCRHSSIPPYLLH